jgi:hypothetical protein
MPLKITFDTNEINNYLRVDDGVDTKLIEGLQAGAMVEAEQFLNTDFATVVINEDGTETITPNEAPAPVKDWVLNRIVEKYENRGKQIKPDFAAIQPHRVYPFRG